MINVKLYYLLFNIVCTYLHCDILVTNSSTIEKDLIVIVTLVGKEYFKRFTTINFKIYLPHVALHQES